MGCFLCLQCGLGHLTASQASETTQPLICSPEFHWPHGAFVVKDSLSVLFEIVIGFLIVTCWIKLSKMTKMLAPFSHGHHMEICKLVSCSEVVHGGERPKDERRETKEGVSMGLLKKSWMSHGLL